MMKYNNLSAPAYSSSDSSGDPSDGHLEVDVKHHFNLQSYSYWEQWGLPSLTKDGPHPEPGSSAQEGCHQGTKGAWNGCWKRERRLTRGKWEEGASGTVLTYMPLQSFKAKRSAWHSAILGLLLHPTARSPIARFARSLNLFNKEKNEVPYRGTGKTVSCCHWWWVENTGHLPRPPSATY